jgi:hypothetical protein
MPSACEHFVTHYIAVSLHSAIGYISPMDRLVGRHKPIFSAPIINRPDSSGIPAQKKEKLYTKAHHFKPNTRVTSRKGPTGGSSPDCRRLLFKKVLFKNSSLISVKFTRVERLFGKQL